MSIIKRFNIPFRILCSIFVFFSTTLLFVGCPPNDSINIGFVGGLSGRVSDLGISGREGVLLAMEICNKTGGINGREIKLMVADDKQNPLIAVEAVKELIQQNVVAIIGHMTSSMSMQTVPIINEFKVLMVSPTTTTTYLSGKDDFFFRVNASTKHYASKMAQHLLNKTEHRKVAIIFDTGNKAYTESWIDIFSQTYVEGGGVIIHKQPYQSSASTSFFDIIEQVPLGKIDALIIVAGAMDTAMLCQQVDKKDIDITILSSEWAATEDLINLGGKAVEGIVVNQFFNRSSELPQYIAFRKAYIERFGNEPGFASVNAYDATNLIFEALKRQSKDETLKQAILKIKEFEGVQGLVRIDEFGDADRKTFLTTIKQGKFALLE